MIYLVQQIRGTWGPRDAYEASEVCCRVWSLSMATCSLPSSSGVRVASRLALQECIVTGMVLAGM